MVCWEGGDPAPFDEFIITDAPAPDPAPSPTSTILPPAVSPETQSQAEVSDATVAPGEQVNVVGGGFAPDRDLRIDLLSDPIFLGSTRSDSGGRFAARVTIPSNASPGPHRIVVSGPGPGGGTHRSIATVNVVMTVARPLARTGASSAGLIRLAILSASVGLALLMCTERRLVTMATIGLGRGPRSARRKHSTIWRGARPRRWPLI